MEQQRKSESSSDSEDVTRQRGRTFLLRWCPILLLGAVLMGFVIFEHTQISQFNNKKALDENAKRFSQYPYDSNEIVGSKACFWPILTDSDMSQLDPLERTARIECRPRFARLFTLQESGILLPEVANNDFAGVECMSRSMDDLESLAQPLTTEGPTFIVGAKRVFVECLRNESIIYSREFVNFAAPPLLAKTAQREPNDLNLSLSIISLDSVSFAEFHRLMPQTSRYMRYLGFIDSEMFNKINFNQSVHDLLLRGDRPVWEVMRDRGCVSFLSHGHPNGTVDYSSVDYFMDGDNGADMNSTEISDQCGSDGRPTAVGQLEAFERFQLHYSHKCTFAVQTVDGFRERRQDRRGKSRWFSRLAALDAQLRSTLERLVANSIADRTAIVIMGDLGNKHNENTQTGRVMQSAPLFSIRMPHGFRQKRPAEAARLYKNRKRMTTSNDIAETLQHIARGFEKELVIKKEYFIDAKGKRQEKGYWLPTSQFADIYNPWRGCNNIGVSRDTCQCQFPRPGRGKSIKRGSPRHLAVRELMSNEFEKMPCIKTITDTKAEPVLTVLEPQLLPKIRSKKNNANFAKGHTPIADVEYFRADMNALVLPQPFRTFPWTLRVRGHVRHDVRTDEYELIGEIAIMGNTVGECTAQRIRDFCQLCTAQGFDDPMEKDANEFEGDGSLLTAVTHL